MKWFQNDLQKYGQAKEYIDTLLIPLQAFHFSEDESLVKDAFQREVLSIYANEIEKELSGRLMLAPTYFYLKSSETDVEIERLNSWVKDVQQQPFKTVFLMTFDNKWKKVEKDLEGNLLWLPGLKPMDINSKEAVSVIRNQIEQISELIRSYW